MFYFKAESGITDIYFLLERERGGEREREREKERDREGGGRRLKVWSEQNIV